MSKIISFYGEEMSLLELMKHIYKWKKDPCHYEFIESFKLLIEQLEALNYRYAFRLANKLYKEIRGETGENNNLPNDFRERFKRIYNNIKKRGHFK